MKDLILGVLKAIPGYIITLWRIIATPRVYVFGQVMGSNSKEQTLGHALTTLALSTLATLLMTNGSHQLPSKYTIVMALLFRSIEVFGVAIILWLSWRTFSRPPSFEDFAIAFAYLFSPALLAFVGLDIIEDGGLRLIDQSLFAQLSQSGPFWKDVYLHSVFDGSDEQLSQAFHSQFFLWMAAMLFIRVTFQFVWGIIAWSILTRIVQASWLRAIGAALLACFLSALGGGILFLIQMGLG
jgi:hypothetical protein